MGLFEIPGYLDRHSRHPHEITSNAFDVYESDDNLESLAR